MSSAVPAAGPDIFARVWNIYDDYRTSLFNEKYFEKELSRLQTWSMRIDILTAAGTSTTGIAGWSLWSSPEFAWIWACFAGAAITLSAVRPVLKWDEKIVSASKKFNAYSKTSYAYQALVRDIAFHRQLIDGMIARHEEISRAFQQIEKVPQGPPNLLSAIQREVNEQYPVQKFWSPPKS